MDQQTQQAFKEKLLARKEEITATLSTFGHRDPSVPGDWEPNPAEGMNEADPNVLADAVEAMAESETVVSTLETELKLVDHALEKFDLGTYGICEVSGEPIEEARLRANPAARTSIAHVGEEDSLAI
jgi:RNA polymerase-binding transcription factor DksA